MSLKYGLWDKTGITMSSIGPNVTFNYLRVGALLEEVFEDFHSNVGQTGQGVRLKHTR
jgi:hypothetical protein